MSEVTEVYSCREGQELKQGKLDYVHDITTREQAEADARARCQRDPSIRKVAYYSVGASGKFRNFFTYTNPNPASADRGGGTVARTPRATARKAPPRKPTLVQKIAGLLGLEK